MGLLWIPVIALVLTGISWIAVARTGRLGGSSVGAGLAIGIFVSFLLALIWIGIFKSTWMLPEQIPASAALALFLVIGLGPAIAFLWLGVTLMPIGLLRWRSGWTLIGVWLTAGAVLAAAATGYLAYQRIQQEAQRPIVRAGTVTLELASQRSGRVSATGPANCTLYRLDDSFWITSGQQSLRADEPLTTSDGRDASVDIILRTADQVRVRFQIDASTQPTFVADGPFDPSLGGTHEARLRAGSTRDTGTIEILTHAADLTAGWGGTVSWDCSAR